MLGRADTAGSELAAPASTSDTTLLVATPAFGAPPWTTCVADFPAEVLVGCEVMTVTGIAGGSPAGQLFTVQRGADAAAWPVGTSVQVAPPATQPPALIGTRGQFSSSDYENIIESLNGSPQYVDGVYVNVRNTFDNVPILMHDSTVDRTTDGTGSVESLTLLQIKTLDAGGGAEVPTLEEYLQAVIDLETAEPNRRILSRLFLNPRSTSTAQITETHTVATDAAFSSITGRYTWMFGDIDQSAANQAAAADLRSLDATALIGSWVGPSASQIPTSLSELAAVSGSVLLVAPHNIYHPQPGALDQIVAAGLETGVARTEGDNLRVLPLLYGDTRISIVWTPQTDEMTFWNADASQAALTGAAHLHRGNPSHVIAL